MTAKEYLGQYLVAGREIKRLRAVQQRMDTATPEIPGYRSPKLGNDRVQGGPLSSSNTTSDRNLDNWYKCQNRILELEALQQEIEDTINMLPEPRREVMFWVYLWGDSVETISHEMYYSPKQIYRLHKKALEEVDELLKLRNNCGHMSMNVQ